MVFLKMKTENPLFKTLNLVPGMQSFSHFHDALNYSGWVNKISIPPAYLVSQGSAILPYYQIYNNVQNAEKVNEK